MEADLARMLTKFVPEGLAERLEHGVAGGSSLTDEAIPTLAERREVTILFADLAGFTALSERLDPEEVVSVVNRFFALVAGVTRRWGGAIDKYLGDAALVLFGAPRAVEQASQRAVAAALELQQGIRQVAEEVAREYPGVDVRATCAIARGLVVAGIVGAESRCEYTVIGDPVNTAARLQKACSPGEVVVDAAVAEELDTDASGLVLEPLPPLPAKGKSRLLAPVRVRALAEAVPSEPGLIGRKAELAAIDRHLRQLAEGQGGALLLVGGAGMGKSALLGAMRRRARARGFAVIDLPAGRQGPGSLLAAIFELAGDAAGLRMLETGDTAGLPALAARALASRSGGGRFVVCLDGLDDVDSPSRASLLRAVPALREAGGLLVATATSKVAGARAVEQLPVGPLPAFDAKKLLAQLRPADADDHPLLERLAAEAGGVPARLLALSGRPDTSALLARVDRLSPAGADLLAVLSLVGSADLDLLASAAGLDPARASAVAAEALAAGLVTQSEGRITFHDQELAPALRARLVAARRRCLHAAIAAALETRGEEAQAVVHRAEGDDPAAAAGAHAVLAERLLDLGQPADALAQAHRGLDRARAASLDSTQLKTIVGRAQLALGKPTEAASTLFAAWREARDEQQATQAAVELARLFWQRGSLDLAAGVLEKEWQRVGADEARRARVAKERGALAFEQGDLAGARAWWTQAADLARRCGARALQGRCEMNLGLVLNVEGQRERALEAYAAASPMLEEDAPGLALLAHNVAISLDELGRHEEALVVFGEVLEMAANASEIRLGAMVRCHRARLLTALGRYAEAQGDAQSAQEVFGRLGDVAGLGDAHKLLGIIARAQGRRSVAEAYLRQAVQQLVKAKVKLGAAEALEELAQLAEGSAARFYLQEALALYAEIGAVDRAEAIRDRLASARSGDGVAAAPAHSG